MGQVDRTVQTKTENSRLIDQRKERSSARKRMEVKDAEHIKRLKQLFV